MTLSVTNFPARRAGALARHAGFTLIEIMVVVVIIGILAAIVAPSVLSRIDDANIAKVKQDLRNLDTALTMYRMDNFKYPSTDQGLAALATRPTDTSVRNWREYMKQVPKDPWGNPYHYLSPGQHGEYDLFTLGADNQEGGEGINADIGNWNATE